jgi:hypothetical protein
MPIAGIEHEDWDAEMSQLSKGKEKLPLVISCVPKLSDSQMPMTTEVYQWIYTNLKCAPFAVNDSTVLKHDLVARFSFQKTILPSGLAYACFATIFIIPGNLKNTIEASVDILDKDNNLVRRYRRSADYNLWLGWIFFLWGPFAGNMSADGDIIKDLFRDIVKEMYEKDYEFYRDYLR